MRKRLYTIAIVLLLMALIGLASGVLADLGKQFMGWIIARKVTVQGATDLLSTLDVAGATTMDDTLAVSGPASAADGLTVVGAVTATHLVLNSITVSGPYVFSYTAAVVDGTQISHTLGTTPTMVLFTPYTVSLPVSCTVFVRGLDPYNITVGMTPSQNLRLYWMVGK